MNTNKTNQDDFGWIRDTNHPIMVSTDNAFIGMDVVVSKKSDYYRRQGMTVDGEVMVGVVQSIGELEDDGVWCTVVWSSGERNEYLIGPRTFDLMTYIGEDDLVSESNDFDWINDGYTDPISVGEKFKTPNGNILTINDSGDVDTPVSRNRMVSWVITGTSIHNTQHMGSQGSHTYSGVREWLDDGSWRFV